MTCNEICQRYKAIGKVTGGRYKNGQKRCHVCDIFIKFDGIRCPCCGYQLRSNPRNKKYKAKLRNSPGKKS